MRKVVIDTNVAVSALLTPTGNAARIIDMITDEKLQLCYNAEILGEYVEVLSRPRFHFYVEDREGFIAGVKQFGLLVSPNESDIPFIDGTDRVFYDVAKFCEADLVTGNVKHYPDELFIMTPSTFLASLDEK